MLQEQDEKGAAMDAFMGSDGTVWHSRCERPLEYHGTRDGLVVDFFCADCQEHVSLALRDVRERAARGERGVVLPAMPLPARGRELSHLRGTALAVSAVPPASSRG